MGNAHYLCSRCGIIMTDLDALPAFCPKCGGVQVVDIGPEGEYNLKAVKKEHKAPFRPDVFHKVAN